MIVAYLIIQFAQVSEMSARKESKCMIRLVLKSKANESKPRKTSLLSCLNSVPSLMSYKSTESTKGQLPQLQQLDRVSEQCLKLLTEKTAVEPKETNNMLSLMTEMMADFKKEKARESSAIEGHHQTKQKFTLSPTKQMNRYFSHKQPKLQLPQKQKEGDFIALSIKKSELSPKQRLETIKTLPRDEQILSPRGKSSVSPSRFSRNSTGKKIVISPPKPRQMHFSNDNSEQEYIQRLKAFLDFLFKINFSNGIYVDLALFPSESPRPKYKVYVSPGNNHAMVMEVLQRRSWFEVTDCEPLEDYDLYWTNNPIAIPKRTETKKQFDELTLEGGSLLLAPVQSRRKLLMNLDQDKKIMSAKQARAAREFMTQSGYRAFRRPYDVGRLTNHIPNSQCLTIKRNLLQILKDYYYQIKQSNPFTVIPRSYHIKSASDFQLEYFQSQHEATPNKPWLMKPAAFTNQGDGIQVVKTCTVAQRMAKRQKEGQFIIQQYIQYPLLLIDDRKFDIRHFLLVTVVGGRLKGYWPEQGYIRTSSCPFVDQFQGARCVHLTNDAVQARCPHYGKFQPANKLSYGDLQRHMTYNYFGSFQNEAIPQMKAIARDLLLATYQKLIPETEGTYFQIFGLDYMLDEDMKIWLLQVNDNPSLDINCLLLDHVIRIVVEQAVRIAVDPLLPPRNNFSARQRNYLSADYQRNLKYQLIFDSLRPQENCE